MGRLIDADALKDVFTGQPPEYYTTAYVTGLIDRMPTATDDNDIISLCRSGVVKKFVCKGVVIMNYDWWSRMVEKDGCRPVPTPEQLEERLPDKTAEEWWGYVNGVEET